MKVQRKGDIAVLEDYERPRSSDRLLNKTAFRNYNKSGFNQVASAPSLRPNECVDCERHIAVIINHIGKGGLWQVKMEQIVGGRQWQWGGALIRRICPRRTHPH